MTEQELLQNGIGRKLIFLGRAADMISVSLSSTKDCSSEFAIHILTDCEICFCGRLFARANEVYYVTQSGRTVYDEKVAQLMSSGKDYVLENLSYDSHGCLHVEFSNELMIRTLSERSMTDADDELWRVFLVHAATPHLIGTASGVYLEEANCTQQELENNRNALHEVLRRKGWRQTNAQNGNTIN